jgi:zinc/manganese transport system substrate-binding protein
METACRTRSRFGRIGRTLLVGAVCAAAGIGSAGCLPSASTAKPGQIVAVAAEIEYANVLTQIGGRYVSVSAILDNPNTDPHSFELSPSIAEEVSAAQVVVQNGVGYDAWMNSIEAATPSGSRKVIVAQQVLGLPDSTPNPHLWYDPRTMPLVAKAMASGLSQLQPDHASYFAANLRKFDESLQPWLAAVAAFKAQYPGAKAATTEPVADYLLQAMGIDNLTPFRFQADIMNGVDPSPQDITLEKGLFAGHKVSVFCYNEQVVSLLTSSVRQAAQSAGVPVVGVYETMPTPGYTYQSWMLAEVHAIEKAVVAHASTEQL